MIANNEMNRWYALYTAPRSERKLMQRLNAAGYTAFCLCKSYSRNGKDKPKKCLCLCSPVAFLLKKQLM